MHKWRFRRALGPYNPPPFLWRSGVECCVCGGLWVEGCTGTPLFACCTPLLGDTAPPAGGAALRFPCPSGRVGVCHTQTHTNTQHIQRTLSADHQSNAHPHKHTITINILPLCVRLERYYNTADLQGTGTVSVDSYSTQRNRKFKKEKLIRNKEKG